MTTTPQICFSLTSAFDAVVTRFHDEDTGAENHFGWREPQKHKLARARIVWVPGDPGGAVGELVAPSKSGDKETARALANLRELFTVYVSDQDPQFPEDERKQYEATRALYDAWYRALYKAAHGTFQVASLIWNTSKNERRHGAELVCVCWIEAVIPDAPYTLADPPIDGEIITSLEDVDEVTTTATP